MNNASARHVARVAALGCLICRRMGLGESPACIHHVREGQGMSQRAADTLVIPLCREHHQGASGIHGLGTREFERRYKVTELDLLAEAIERIS